MKTTKRILFTHALLLFAFAAYAEPSGNNDTSSFVHHSTPFSIQKIKFVRADSAPDVRHVEMGLRYMPTFSSMDINTYSNGVVDGSFTYSNGFGAFLGINLTKNIGVIGEVNYYQSTQQYADRSFTHDLTVNYLNIPLMLSLNTNKAAAVNLNLVAGPQFGINVGSKYETSGSGGIDSVQAAVALKKGDVGLAYGAGLEFALNKNHTFRLDVGYRGFFGLVNMDASTNDQGTYNVIVSASRKTYGGYVGLAWMF
jgi:opacity protein-like surface antigen